MITNTVIAVARGSVIASVGIPYGDASVLEITFTDGKTLSIGDEPQCRENRYMHSDDDLDYYVGAALLGVTVEDGPCVDDDYDVHEEQFLHVKTSRGSFTIVSHNEHNGYYRGFDLTAELKEKEN